MSEGGRYQLVPAAPATQPGRYDDRTVRGGRVIDSFEKTDRRAGAATAGKGQVGTGALQRWMVTLAVNDVWLLGSPSRLST